MKCLPAIKTFSSISIILGIASVTLQIILWIKHFPSYSLDLISYGLFVGVFYVITGGLGLGSACNKNSALFLVTIVFGSLSIAGSVPAAAISAIASASFNYCYQYECETSQELVLSLMGVSILALLNSITLTVLASVAICNGQDQPMGPMPYAGLPQGYAQPVNYANQFHVPVNLMQNVQPVHYPSAAGFHAQPNIIQHEGQYITPGDPNSRSVKQTS